MASVPELQSDNVPNAAPPAGDHAVTLIPAAAPIPTFTVFVRGCWSQRYYASTGRNRATFGCSAAIGVSRATAGYCGGAGIVEWQLGVRSEASPLLTYIGDRICDARSTCDTPTVNLQ